MRRRRLNLATVSLMAFLWLVQAAHCKIGIIPGLDLLACATDDHSESGAHSCCGGTCRTLESQVTQADEKKRLAAPQSDPEPWVTAAPATLTLAKLVAPVVDSLVDVPPEFSRRWQFLLRAAPCARAPSFAS